MFLDHYYSANFTLDIATMGDPTKRTILQTALLLVSLVAHRPHHHVKVVFLGRLLCACKNHTVMVQTLAWFHGEIN